MTVDVSSCLADRVAKLLRSVRPSRFKDLVGYPNNGQDTSVDI